MPANLSLVIAMLLWGSSFIALKYTVQIYDPEFVIFFRMLLTLVCCLLLWRWTRIFNYQKGDWKFLLCMSLAEPCFYFLLEGHALKYTSAAQAGVLASCLPIFVAILAYFILKERISRYIVLGFGFCILGSISLSLVSPVNEHASNPLLGNMLEIGAMFCAAFYTVCLKKLSPRYSPISLIGLQGLSGTLFFAPFLFVNPFPETHHWSGIASIVYLSVVVTLGAYGLYNHAVQKVSVLKAAAFSNLIPVFSLFLSMLILDEYLQLHQWLAIAVIFVGVYISQRHKGDRQDVAQPMEKPG